jgi:ATP-dependent exoDNAse (exonuclease V) beta subunit
MKEYNHKTINLPEITAKTADGVRLYETPEGNKYPSITTVLSVRNKKGLFEWRKRVGEEVANYVAQKAANRGTAVHQMCEDFLNNMSLNYPDSWAQHKKKFLPYTLFKQLRNSVLQKVNNIYAQECGLYSDKYKVAGRVDCIAEYNGKLSIIDFKTSTKERSDAWNESYYIQASAYAEMFEERTGIAINQICILVVTEDGVVQEFVKDKTEYLPMLTDTIKEWEEKNEMVTSTDINQSV